MACDGGTEAGWSTVSGGARFFVTRLIVDDAESPRGSRLVMALFASSGEGGLGGDRRGPATAVAPGTDRHDAAVGAAWVVSWVRRDCGRGEGWAPAPPR